MNREEVIKLAREAGAMFDHMTWVERDLAPVFERFAALVAAHEREAIMKICNRHTHPIAGVIYHAIRARGNT